MAEAGQRPMREPTPDAEISEVPAHDREPGHPEEDLDDDQCQQQDARHGHEKGRHDETLEAVRGSAGRFALGRRRLE